MRRLIVIMLAPATLLTACAAPADEPTEPSVVSSSTVTQTSSPDETVPSSQEPSEGEPSASESQEAAPVDVELDLQDGIRTNDFGRMPTQVGGFDLVDKETNPGEHTVQIVYETPDEESAVQFMAYFPLVGDVPTPVRETSDEGYRLAVDSAARAYEESETTVEKRSVNTGGLQWDCIEAVGEDIDRTLCVSLRFGRVLDVQHVTVHDDDASARHPVIDQVLADVGEGVAGLA